MPDIRQLSPDEWKLLRDARLSALQDSPDSFLAQYADEKQNTEEGWRAEFTRGTWHIGQYETDIISLIGVTREDSTETRECFLEYIWVAPGERNSGMATWMVNHILGDLTRAGVRNVYLWVMNGNDRAVQLYKGIGFEEAGAAQAIEKRPGRFEQRFVKRLGERGRP